MCNMKTKLYDKRLFQLCNCEISTHVATFHQRLHAYGEYIDRGLLLTGSLLNQEFQVNFIKTSCFFLPLLQMATDIF